MNYQLLNGVEDEVDYLFLTGTLTQNSIYYKIAVVENIDHGGGGTGNYQVVLQSRAGTFSFLIYKDFKLNRWVRENQETDDIDKEKGISAGEIIVENDLFDEVSDSIVFPVINANVIQEIGITIEQIKKQYVLSEQRKSE